MIEVNKSVLEWLKNLNEVIPEDPTTRQVLGIPRLVPDNFPSEAMALGLWNIVPIGEGGIKRYRHLHAVQLVGSKEINSSRLVRVRFNTMITMASSLLTAVPMSIFRARLNGNPDGWRAIDKQWEDLSPSLVRLHRFLGGKDDLSVLFEVIRDKELEEKVNRALNGELNEGAIAASILERIDSSHDHVTYRNFLCDLENEATTPPPELNSLGSWSSAAAVAVLMAYKKHRTCSNCVLEAAWKLARGSAGLDTNVAGIEQVPSGGGLSSDMRLELAANILKKNQNSVPKTWKENPLWRATMKLAEDEKAYDGYAHVEAARDLDEAGQPLQAFDALQAAAFWSITNRDQPLTPAFEAAHSIAGSQGWTSIVEYMSYLAKRHNELTESHEN